ncbi:DNA-directed RNA polymerase subunit beta' [Dictyobacter alpinus]|uniref:DNA-directed RNA polymerase subunit beta' n=2 Tax=Dictyobacter alpinus TaxID=2014873 RepID=A0A402BL05_9CHLR|nr:DNA-directed RNA polymerase subunit beta' [Dictyobacter alpinus]
MEHMDAIAGLRLTLASPERIRSWSHGEVTEPETINYRTGQPEPNGLFSERIFGPTKDWSCACGKYKRVRTPGTRCEKCGVEMTTSSVRRERMGHIDLVVPVAHSWFARNAPSTIALLLDLSPRQLSALLSYSVYIVLSLDEDQRQEHMNTAQPADLDKHCTTRFAGLRVGEFLDEEEYRVLSLHFGHLFTAQTGAIAVRALLGALDLENIAAHLRRNIQHDANSQKKAIKRLHLVEAFRESCVDPAWMILEAIPVLPPELRPLVPLGGGRYAASDVNALYERVIYRNNRIKQFLAMNAPEMILNHERRLLQDACDALFDNGRRKNPVIGSHKQALKSLTDTLKGKEGRFRRNLLGKRVDYSGRSVIVGDTSLKLHQCGLPTKICLELFKPFLIRKLMEWDVAPHAHAAKKMIERTRKRHPVIWDALEEVMRGKVVLLNRAPTLHRLSIQAFEAVRMDGSQAIRLHPCVCSAFNADFDGDQMSVHLPLSDLAQAEARALMLSTRNLRAPASGEPAISISQEMVLGLFYLTQERPSAKSTGRIFADAAEAHIAFEHGIIDLHTRFFVRIPDEHIFETPGLLRRAPERKRMETTLGRLIFNEVLPAPLRFKNYEMTKERLKQVIAECLETCGEAKTAKLADALKQLGFRYATRSGISFSVLSDIEVPPEKQGLLAQAEVAAQEIEEQLHAGMITADERYQHLIEIWTKATDAISKRLEAALDPWGSLATIIRSGATKAKFQQIRQLSGIRGLMASPTGRIIAIPIRGNYLEGLKVWEIFIAASGARKGFMDRSLNTARSGYLTRRLVEAAIEVWITSIDCGTQAGLLITQEESKALGLPNMSSRLLGRVLAEPLPEVDLPCRTLLDDTAIERIIAADIPAVLVRSPLTCEASYGICQGCYGLDLATARLVRLGAAVGIVAAQAVGEPGTQLTMRTFHSGGVAHAQGDITQGLPRVEELFDARHPKNMAILSEIEGMVTIEKGQAGPTRLHVRSLESGEERCYDVPLGKQLLIEDGTQVRVGQLLNAGHPDPQALLQLCGREAVARYLVNEVQQVYRSTGVYIADKHVECIVRQMVRYVFISEAGDTSFLPGEVVDRFFYAEVNARILAQGGQAATARPILLGLTKSVLQTHSWLAAASFQETSRVLTRAAIRGQWDNIRGFKERLIIGRRLPMASDIAKNRDTVRPGGRGEVA